MAAADILDFQKLEFLTVIPLPNFIKIGQKYGDLTVFKMAAVRRLGFVKFEIFNGRSG